MMFTRPIMKVALRDLRRNLGMSILAILLIATPVAAITFFAAIFQTSVADDMARSFPEGRQATIMSISDTVIEQSATGDSAYGSETKVDAPEEPFVDVLEQIVAPNTVVIDLDGLSFALLAKGPGFTPIDAWNPAQQVSKSELIDGRLPREGEVALAERDALLLDASIGDTILDQGEGGGHESQDEVTVVGITKDNTVLQRVPLDLRAATYDELSGLNILIRVEGTSPVTWEQVKELNQFGLMVTSKYVLENPPPESELYPVFAAESAFVGGSTDNAAKYAIAVMFLLAVIEVILIITPAFTTAAKRNERNLAQLAAVGATRQQLRGTMIWQGIFLGLLGAALGIAAFFASTLVLRSAWTHTSPTITWWLLPLAVVIALALGLIAALWPARRASQVDVVAVLANRGTGRVPSQHKALIAPIVAVLASAGALVLAGQKVTNTTAILLAAILLIAVIAMLFSAPLVIRTITSLISRISVNSRLAGRDASRNMHRTGPAVAAISMVILMATVLVSLTQTVYNSTRLGATFVGPAGSIVVQPNNPGSGGDPHTILDYSVDEIDETRSVNHVTYFDSVGTDNAQFIEVEFIPDPECLSGDAGVSNSAKCNPYTHNDLLTNGHLSANLIVGTPEVVDRFGAIRPEDKAEAKQILAAGGIITYADGFVVDGTSTLSVFDLWVEDSDGTRVTQEELDTNGWEDGFVEKSEIVKRKTVPAKNLQDPAGISGITLISPDLAEELDLTVKRTGAIIEFEDPLNILDTREVTPYTLTANNTVVISLVNQASFELVAVPLGVSAVFVLIAICVATAVILLSARAARNDMDTLSAVGAAPGTRRKFTMWLGVIAVVAGTLPGLLAGIVATQAVSNLYRTDFTIAMGPMLLVLLALVAIAAVIGLLFPPRTRGLTRRMD